MLMGLDLPPERPGEQWAASSHVWGVDMRWTLRGCPASVLGLGTLAGGWAQEDPQAPRGPPRSSASPRDACTPVLCELLRDRGPGPTFLLSAGKSFKKFCLNGTLSRP